MTEIYICRHGQKLQEGRLLYSRDIRSRTQAMEDAVELCAGDASIRRVAYYALDDGGEARLLLSYANPGFPHRPVKAQWRPPVRRDGWRPVSRARRRPRTVPAWNAWARACAWLTDMFAHA